MSPAAPADEVAPFAPIRNGELIGQDRAEQTFLDAFNSGRLPHAWLLSGPRGVGKATLAHRIARFLLVHGNPSGGDEGPGLFGDDLPAAQPHSLATDLENPVCKRIIAGGHTDFLCIERAVNEDTGAVKRDISVDQVRAIGNLFTLTPGEGGWRVVVIDAVDDLNDNGANAVLKMLEEPPSWTVLLLVSHNPGRLLPTIHSRCRHLSLPPLDGQSMEALLAAQGQMRGLDLGADERALLMQLAGGSIGRAFTLADDGGLDLYRDMTAILETLPNLDIGMLHKLGDLVARDRGGDRFRTLAELIDWSLVARIRGELSASALEGWFRVWEKANRLFRETEGLSLDRKQVVLEVFLLMEDAARG
jgi:DNA polymerase-3 subunit delta'